MTSQKRWEIPLEDWDTVRDATRRILREAARDRGVISYSDLVARVGHFDGPDSYALAEMLGEINAIEAPYSDEPLLISAVVTHKDDKYPGKGVLRRRCAPRDGSPRWRRSATDLLGHTTGTGS